MKIEFETQEFTEDDDRWNALFVKVNNGEWHLAMAHYGTENKNRIVNMLDEDEKYDLDEEHWKYMSEFNERREKYGEWDPWEPEPDN